MSSLPTLRSWLGRTEEGQAVAGGCRWGATTTGSEPEGSLFVLCPSAEREEIAVGRAADESLRLIALRLGRSPLTTSRELTLNTDQHDR